MTYRIASIGDSFTEGVGDHGPDGALVGWADRMVAAVAAARAPEPVEYVNLAIRGRLLEPIATEQLDRVLSLDPRPDLITMAGGGNDMMRPGWRMSRLMELYGEVVRRTRGAGVQLFITSGGDPSARLPRGDMVVERARELMAAIAELVADEPHIIFVDNVDEAPLASPRCWAEDRLHLNSLGHHYVAARALTALGVPTPLPDVDTSAVPRASLLAQTSYTVKYVLPWIGRRLLGRSSGDGRQPKYPVWTPVPVPGSDPQV